MVIWDVTWCRRGRTERRMEGKEGNEGGSVASGRKGEDAAGEGKWRQCSAP